MGNTDTPPVRAGSVWADNSITGKGRSLRVERIEHGYAICKTLTNSWNVQRDLDQAAQGVWPLNARDMRGSVSRIRLDRFRPTTNGYTLITDAPQTAGQNAATLPALAEVITTRLRDHFPAETEQHRQVLNLAEETGEFVGAYRRWAGLARRTGTWEDVTAELADVVITAYVTACVLGIDLDVAWHAKAHTVLTRGWRELAA